MVHPLGHEMVAHPDPEAKGVCSVGNGDGNGNDATAERPLAHNS
jgi:hypothetical protein